MRVLYLDGVGAFGGASRSLYEAVRAMPPQRVEALFVVQRGTVVPLYASVATDLIATRGLTRFDNTRYSHYRGRRWLVLLRELAHVPSMLAALRAARRRWGAVDLIHANEVTEIIPLLIARWMFKAPAVVHVRSLARVDPRSWRCRWLVARLRGDVEAVVAIDENVRATLPADVPVDVIHNAFTPERATVPDEALRGRLERLRPTSLKLGFVGNLHRSKGIFDLLEATRLARTAGADIELVVVGGATRRTDGLAGWLLRTSGLAQDVAGEVDRRIDALGLRDVVHLVGGTRDIQQVYERIDVLCFPSHFDAPGRPVFEAAFSGVPSITAVRDPRPDSLVPGETGLAVPGSDPERLATAIGFFASRRDEVARMGANARRLAEANFNAHTNANALLALYERTVRRAHARPLQPSR